jgi:hypothetical protein
MTVVGVRRFSISAGSSGLLLLDSYHDGKLYEMERSVKEIVIACCLQLLSCPELPSHRQLQECEFAQAHRNMYITN